MLDQEVFHEEGESNPIEQAFYEAAPHVQRATFFEPTLHQQVKGCNAGENFRKGDVIVGVNEKFYLCTYKLPGYYYVVVNQNNEWKCSSEDDRVQAACIELVKLHIQKKASLLLAGCYE